MCLGAKFSPAQTLGAMDGKTTYLWKWNQKWNGLFHLAQSAN